MKRAIALAALSVVMPAAMAQTVQVYGILDGTKWHRSALLPFVQIEDLAGVVTDLGAPADQVEAWRVAGLEVVVADPGPHESVPARPRDLRRLPTLDRAAGR